MAEAQPRGADDQGKRNSIRHGRQGDIVEQRRKVSMETEEGLVSKYPDMSNYPSLEDKLVTWLPIVWFFWLLHTLYTGG